MKNTGSSEDHKKIQFTDRQGITRVGIYREVLRIFVDTGGGKDPEDILNWYTEDQVRDWEYTPVD